MSTDEVGRTANQLEGADAAEGTRRPDDPTAGSRADNDGAHLHSRIRFRDLFDEMLAGLFSRPGRTALTTLGTVIGLAALIVTIGLSRTAGSQIVDQFNEIAASQVIVTPKSSGRGDAGVLPWDVEGRLDRLNGVRAAGASADVPNSPRVSKLSFEVNGENLTRTVPVVAASDGMLDAVRGRLAQGRWFDRGNVERHDRVAVIGAELASQFNITRLSTSPAVYVDGEFFSVIGIIDRAERDQGFLSAVVIPSSTASSVFGVDRPNRVIIDVEVGAGELIAIQAPVALTPNTPENLSVQRPNVPKAARDRVSGEVNSLFLALALVSLIVGAIGIANVTLVSVLERTSEIGLRRALGARRRHIAAQVMGESFLIGLIGGVFGAASGVLIVVGVAVSRGWTPVLDLWLPVAAPLVGAVIGLLAGLYPAIRAARMEPVAALRGRS